MRKKYRWFKTVEIIHTYPLQCENPKHCTNGDYVIITECIIMKLDMAIDHIITYPMIYLVLLYLQDWRLKSV